MKTKLFILIAAIAALTMAGCAASGEEWLSPPADDGIAGGETVPEGGDGDGSGDSDGNGNGGDGNDNGNESGSDEPEAELQVFKKYVELTSDGVNIRRGAGTGYTALGVAEKNTRYAYLGEIDGWHKIYYKNSTAYISKKYTKIVEMEASDDETVERVIEEGLKLLGTKYVYGAVRYHDGRGNKLKNFTTSAFDCSSLMQYMFYMGADGHLLDVTTRTQVVQGKTVSRANLKRGDLMFFTNSTRYNKTGVERIGHVALYLGENLILHTASDYAKIEEISAARWKYYIQSQRMI